MNPQSTAIPSPIHTKTHGHLWPISHKPGINFNSPETQQWAVHGQPTCPISVSLFGTEFLTNFLSYKHPSIISHTHSPTSFWTVTNGEKNPKEFLTIRSQVLGPIKRPLTASNQPKHRKTLKNGNKTQVGRNPYLLEFVKTHKSGVHA